MKDGSLNLLLVEDNADDVELLQESLAEIRSFQVETHVANRLGGAMDVMDGGEYDLVFLDLSLPDSQGMDTLRTVRERYPTIPIVIMTGLDSEAIAFEAAQAGAQDYLVKGTVNVDVLARCIRYAIERSRTQQELRVHRDRLEEQVLARTRELQEANRSLTLLATAVEHAAESIVITNPDAIIEYVNPGFEAMSGYSREVALGQHLRMIKSDHHDEAFFANFYKTIKAGRDFAGVFINRKADGSIYICETTVSSVKSGDGEITHFVALQRDVTEFRETQEQLYRSQRMESMGQLASGIAHDFNNILSGIMGYTQFAQEKMASEHAVREDLDRVLEGAHRAKALVAQILAFGRGVEGPLRPLNIRDVIDEAIKLLHASLPNTVELEHHLDSDAGMVLGEPTRLHQIVMNLCTNAYQAFGEEPGTVVVRLEKVRVAEGTGKSLELKAGDYVKLVVSDNGCGMNVETVAQVFDPFFTTRDVGEGTGLGLSVVHGIVRSLNGTIMVDSVPEEGTVFSVYLPKTESTAEELRLQESSIPHGIERLLVVDDEEFVLNMVERMLAELGYTVTAMNNTLDALTEIYARPEDFDLLLTDLITPKMSGLELARQVRKVTEELPIIVMTGRMDKIPAVGNDGLRLSCALEKPFSRVDLATAIRSALDRTNEMA